MLKIEDLMEALHDIHNAHGNVPVFIQIGEEHLEAGFENVSYDEELGRVLIGDRSL